ncbi:bifunctional adenosylcobinamide kinase/adenosylcobinamide-phosphate guanylyltransferase [Pseudooceanicola sp.]|jgi:adenosylcobinamide kinase/adenosylcobinamide-phosphate guanylyltransferase|uniref:bifunctional adenosylcobinamide kinase/adenosylcobinamide-phosphate guanylyltransferase n=1 Tax=Pseudooceanicola sp. TaxID=1914328 RepID=UPI00405993A1|tara:strand:+ start:2481 stop:3002 length:522 start_codon:yes stop_codon:yes gene_type:complete
MASPLTFILGGAASGKSHFAEQVVLSQGEHPLYIATAQAYDAEMQAKIDAHVASRGPRWTTVEAPLDLAEALANAPTDRNILIDCMTLWLTNLMIAGHDLEQSREALMSALSARRGPVTLVSNEVGQGIVPDNALARRFRDAQGRLNIRLAAEADCVVQVVAGLPNLLKGQLS